MSYRVLENFDGVKNDLMSFIRRKKCGKNLDES